MKPTRKESDADKFEKTGCPQCGSAVVHRITKMNNKPYQSWWCNNCHEGWNTTTSDEWNMKQQGIKTQ